MPWEGLDGIRAGLVELAGLDYMHHVETEFSIQRENNKQTKADRREDKIWK